jgi:hypothetical protein
MRFLPVQRQFEEMLVASEGVLAMVFIHKWGQKAAVYGCLVVLSFRSGATLSGDSRSSFIPLIPS